ncbi:MAG: ATP-binding cassette domain-containing protein [Anaerolineae bacterium]|nr:ATP-binding cassette domain-containing protein [Anaerolineae bacterium]MDW8172762.1 ATP-binding cassette domain-containing protein [Anaerolineae bacterium]
MVLLDVVGLTKTFTIHHLDRHIPVFHDLCFRLHEGQFLLVTGQNGAGKSSLLRCLYRTYLPNDGHAYYESRYGRVDLARAADVDIALLRREEIGFVTQFLRPRPRVSALELVAEGLGELGEARARDLLDGFGLKPELYSAYPTTFSGGEQQKVNLAHALARPRRLLLLDEPTASLDAQARRSLCQRLADLKAQGVAMIGVFHTADEIRALVDGEIELRGARLGLPTHDDETTHGGFYVAD